MTHRRLYEVCQLKNEPVVVLLLPLIELEDDRIGRWNQPILRDGLEDLDDLTNFLLALPDIAVMLKVYLLEIRVGENAVKRLLEVALAINSQHHPPHSAILLILLEVFHCELFVSLR